jgi:V8-like Glu-specific endopeptidase
VPQVVAVQTSYLCSGFIASPGLVVTAKHCLHGYSTASITFYDSQVLRFEVAAVGKDEETNDFAILKGQTRGITPMALAPVPPYYGTPCNVIGYAGTPNQMETRCRTEGEVIGVSGLLALHATLEHGDSGSMVIDERGQVLGVAVRTAFPMFETGQAVDIQRVKAVLEKLNASSTK